jgi:hypothetical protein
MDNAEKKIDRTQKNGVQAYGCSDCDWMHSVMSLAQVSWHHPETPVQASFGAHVCGDHPRLKEDFSKRPPNQR